MLGMFATPEWKYGTSYAMSWFIGLMIMEIQL